MIFTGTCAWCGTPFTADSRHASKKRHCSKRCARKTYEASGATSAEAVAERMARAKRTQVAPDAEARYDCRCPAHPGDKPLPIEAFYQWLSPLRVPTRSGWCRECLKKWLVENDMRDNHGQHTEADDQARVEIYEDRLATYKVGGRDAIHIATKLFAGRHVA